MGAKGLAWAIFSVGILLCGSSLAEELVPADSHVPVSEQAPSSPSGYERKTLSSGGLEREYFVFTPSRLQAGEPLPLVVGLHGYTGTATGFEEETSGGMNRHAEQAAPSHCSSTPCARGISIVIATSLEHTKGSSNCGTSIWKSPPFVR